MEWLEVIVLCLSFLGLMALGVPISFAIGLATLATMMLGVPLVPAITTEAQRIATGMDSFVLLAIPFFVLAGQLMNRGGMARRLIDFARAIIGSLPGGLAHINIVAAMLFGAISGSAAAAASAIGPIMGPQMDDAGYEPGFGVAVNVTSATTGLLIPPSNILIVYSLASGGTSIAALFLAGYLPGILVGLMLMVVAGTLAVRRGYPTSPRVNLRVTLVRFLDAIPSLLLLVIIMGGIIGGFFTATEAAAVAVLYSLILALFYREISIRDLPGILLDASVTTAVVMLLVGTSMSMSWIMAYVHIPQTVAQSVLGLTESPIVMLLLVNVILLVVGMFMDMTPAVLIFTPIFLPVALSMGIDPIHFGMMMVLNLCIGLCTPPVGSVLFIGVGIAKTSIAKVIRPLLPMFAAMIVALLLVSYIPWISLFLPRLFGY